jgi:hypothetical protein
MFRRIAAITFILICTSVAWFVLAETIHTRTYQSDDKIRPGVATIWGAPQEQRPPSASFIRIEEEKTKTETDGKTTIRTEPRMVNVAIPLDSSRVDVGLQLEHRQRGLLWYSTYWVDFAGAYQFRNPTSEPQNLTLEWRFPAEHAIYDGFVMEVDGRALPIRSQKQSASVSVPVPAGDAVHLRVAYRSRGLQTWRYWLGDEVTETRDFALTVKTNFRDIDFPLSSLSPTDKRETSAGWELAWRYRTLISGFQIGVAMPEKLQPGPLAGEISYFAPVSLAMFFFLMFIITTMRNIDLHPMNYFFLAAAFFAFHLLLAYLADHISIHLAFLICSAVSVFLVVSYLRLVVGPRFALVEAGGAQFIYLVLFSYAFFWKGFTGLAVTIGCIVTLYVVMQLTARIRWADRFRPDPLPVP